MKTRRLSVWLTLFFCVAALRLAAAFMPDESAPRTISQLESSGQIQTAPSPFELWWWQLMRQLRRWWKAFQDWIGSLFPDVSPAPINSDVAALWLKVLFFGALALVGIVAAILLWRIWKNMPRQADTQTPGDEELFLLPPQELRQRAREFAARGNYREALRHLYISTLMLLDARGIWHYDVNRTNWEHIALLERRSDLSRPLAEMTRRFDRVRYGNADCSSSDWQRFEEHYSDVEARLPLS